MIEEWYHRVIDQEKGAPPADLIILQSINNSTAILYERHHSFCYHDSINDYVVKFLPSYQFLVVYNYLRREYGTRRTTGEGDEKTFKFKQRDNKLYNL